MSRRILAAVFAALILMSGTVLGAEMPGAAQDSTASPLASVHEIYQAAWTLRAAGEYAQSVLRSEEGLALVGKVLADDPDASTRRDLSEMQARLTGLRNEAREEQANARAVEPGNEADDRVLAARAQDDIEPQLFEPRQSLRRDRVWHWRRGRGLGHRRWRWSICLRRDWDVDTQFRRA